VTGQSGPVLGGCSARKTRCDPFRDDGETLSRSLRLRFWFRTRRVQESRYSIPYYPAVIPAPVARGSGYSSSVSSALHSVLHIPCLLVNSANSACVTRSRERTGFRPCTLRNRAQSVFSRAHKSSRSPLLARPRLSPVYGHSLKVYVHQKVDGVRLRASSDAASCARIAASAELASERGRERERERKSRGFRLSVREPSGFVVECAAARECTRVHVHESHNPHGG